MRRALKWTLSVLVVAAISVGMGIGLYKAKKQLAGAPAWKPRPAPVETAVVSEGPLSGTLRYLARLEAVSTAEIAPKISARIITLDADEGKTVAAGDLLARLDDRDIRAQIAAMEAQIEAARARLAGARAGTEAARSNLAYSQREYERDQRLFETKGISASTLEAGRNRMDEAGGKTVQAEEAIRSIEQEIAAQKAQLAEARTRLSYTEIRADYTGTIQSRLAEPGDMAMPGKPIFRMMDVSSHRLGFDLVQEDLFRVKPGRSVRIHWPVPVPDDRQNSTVARIFPSLETDQTIRAEIDLACRCPETLKVGSLIPVEVVVEENRGLIVPRTALAPAPGGGDRVYVIRDGRLKAVTVEVALQHDGKVLVRGELTPGELVAVGEYLQWVRRYDGMAVSL